MFQFFRACDLGTPEVMSASKTDWAGPSKFTPTFRGDGWFEPLDVAPYMGRGRVGEDRLWHKPMHLASPRTSVFSKTLKRGAFIGNRPGSRPSDICN
jgi:hypothetical protein